MRRIVVIIASLFVAGTAFAAKQHRESKKEIDGKVKTAVSAVKSNCGCAPQIAVDWKSFNATKADKANDYGKNIMREFDNIGTVTKEFCNDADSKKLLCSNVKKFLIFSKGVSEADAKYDSRSKTMSIYTSEQMNSGGFKVKSIMEEW